jgi:hypothetical protein
MRHHVCALSATGVVTAARQRLVQQEPRRARRRARSRKGASRRLKAGRRAHPFPELGAAASHLGLLGEEVESADDDLDDSVGPFRPSVGSDMQPELEEILLGQLRQPIAHQRFLARAARPLDLMRSTRRRPEALS